MKIKRMKINQKMKTKKTGRKMAKKKIKKRRKKMMILKKQQDEVNASTLITTTGLKWKLIYEIKAFILMLYRHKC